MYFFFRLRRQLRREINIIAKNITTNVCQLRHFRGNAGDLLISSQIPGNLQHERGEGGVWGFHIRSGWKNMEVACTPARYRDYPPLFQADFGRNGEGALLQMSEIDFSEQDSIWLIFLSEVVIWSTKRFQNVVWWGAPRESFYTQNTRFCTNRDLR